MRSSFKIARVAGIDVYVHITFLMLVAFYGWIYYQAGGEVAAVYGVVFTLLLFFCVLLHEFGHAFAARKFGIHTPDITLYPIGGVARLERMPRNPWQEFVIAVAGPAVNVVIAGVLWVLLGGPGMTPDDMLAKLAQGRSIFVELLVVNVLLVAFNMIPAFPMDGGRVLRALLATQLDYAQATLIAARVGQTLAVLCVLANLFPELARDILPFLDNRESFSNPILILIAAFVFFGAQQELNFARLRQVASSVRIGDAMITQFSVVTGALRAVDVRDFLIGASQNVFPVVGGNGEFRGMISREELSSAAKELGETEEVASRARAVPTITPDQTFENALELMNSRGEPVLAVVDGEGKLLGVVDAHQLQEMMQPQGAQ